VRNSEGGAKRSAWFSYHIPNSALRIHKKRFLMDRSPTTFLALIVLGVLGIGYFIQQKKNPDGGDNGSTSVGGPTSVVVASDFGQVESAITAAKGKVVLVDCWATWCGPCVSSFPKVVKKSEKYGSKGLTVISVSLDDLSNTDDVNTFLKNQHATFQNFQINFRENSMQQGLQDKLGFQGSIPHAALFDRTGKRVWSGNAGNPELEQLIESELSKSQ